jgi:hypothetical protein
MSRLLDSDKIAQVAFPVNKLVFKAYDIEKALSILWGKRRRP